MPKAVSILPSIRLPFLVLGPVCVMLAVAIAHHQQVVFSNIHAFISLVGAFL